MQLQFLGAAGTVTGSKTLVTHGETRVMVDCGLFQGFKALRERNWRGLPVDPEDLDAVVLTHAHIDHSGYLPRLVADGYRGPVYCTPPTADLLALLLPDSGHLQEEDARFANHRGYSRHRPAKPLYTEQQAVASLKRLEPVPWGEPVRVGELTVTFRPAGHILGASLVRIDSPEGSVLFSGDLGRPGDRVMPPPAEVTDVPELLVLESTYGDRLHGADDPLDALAEVVSRTAERGGMVVIPAFAVGRAQAVLYGLFALKRAGRIPADLPVFLNSPMAVDTTGLYLRHADQHRLSEAETRAMCSSAQLVRTVDDSKKLNQRRGPGVIISASGMCTGGRVLHHLVAFAPDSRNTLLFVGFQASGTRGASILAGAKQVKIHGEQVPIRCEVQRIDAWSAHADHREILDWLGRWPSAPRHVVLNHGEPVAAEAMRVHIQGELGWPASVAELGELVSLSGKRHAAPAVHRQPPVADGPRRGRRRRAPDPSTLPPAPPVADTLIDAALRSLGAEVAVVVLGDVEPRWADAIRRLPALARGDGLRPGALVVAGGALAEALEDRAHSAGVPVVPVETALVAVPHLPSRCRAVVAFPGGYGTLAVV
jgi:metallo-beta-lactamase family protein